MGNQNYLPQQISAHHNILNTKFILRLGGGNYLKWLMPKYPALIELSKNLHK